MKKPNGVSIELEENVPDLGVVHFSEGIIKQCEQVHLEPGQVMHLLRWAAENPNAAKACADNIEQGGDHG